jgi:hypothetical protein
LLINSLAWYIVIQRMMDDDVQGFVTTKVANYYSPTLLLQLGALWPCTTSWDHPPPGCSLTQKQSDMGMDLSLTLSLSLHIYTYFCVCVCVFVDKTMVATTFGHLKCGMGELSGHHFGSPRSNKLALQTCTEISDQTLYLVVDSDTFYLVAFKTS